ncbi:hypothetical protein OAJ65_02730 [Flavobacteriales bacterium]|nr:hypothetical protein [Flavobacteriales bacterium]
MKKLTIILLALFFIGITNINAQTDAIISSEVITEEVTLENHPQECPFTKNAEGKLVCVKTGKICDDACKNKAKGTCCKGKAKKCCKGKAKRSSCSKSKKGGFNYNKSNNYGNKTNSKCSAKKITKCGAECTKPCCLTPSEEEDTPTEE